MEIGMVRKVDIDREMQQSYLDYAMSVIVARALPDARDGLKPVQRRILYAMYDMGLRADSTTKKSARIVGEVLGKYHPHGDLAVYEAMARLAQGFTMRYPLVDGQGNFGSVDGDPPAAMRYTEARLTAFALDMLVQLDRNTVNFTRNFDDTLDEPEVLPAALPNLLVNGANGIAVGMATSIPPHNLGEVVDALSFMLREWDRLEDISVTDLVKYIQGPDLPTGGIILQDTDQNNLLSAYGTGRGKVIVRGRVHFEEMTRGKNRIIITELPYQVNKAALIERIAELAREGVIEGISDLRDESDRQGMRIVIEVSKAAEEANILRELYKRTPLQSTLSITLLALVGGEPRLLTLKQALRVYLDHRIEVIRRRSEFDLQKAQNRLHILEGLRIALKYLDEIIAIIRAAPDVETAHARLKKRCKLSDIQTQSILELPLRRLAALERKKIEQDYKDTLALIKELEGLLKSPKKLRGLVETELLAMRQLYADRRRTQIVSLKDGETVTEKLTTTDMTPAQVTWVGVSADGKIGRTLTDELPRFSSSMAPRFLLRTSSHHTLYLVAENGRAAAIPVHSLPEVEKFPDGFLTHKACPLDEGDAIVAVFSVPPRLDESGDRFVVTVSRQGLVKKSNVFDLPGPSSQAFVLTRVNSDDYLRSCFLSNGSTDLVLATERGMMIRFLESDVRPMGLAAAGVNGIKLAGGDQVAGAVGMTGEGELLVITSDGHSWRLNPDAIPVQGRYGLGVQLAKFSPGITIAGVSFGRSTQGVVMHFRHATPKQARMDQSPIGRRLTKGFALLEVKSSDQIVSVTSETDTLSFWEPSSVRKTRSVSRAKSTPKEAVGIVPKKPARKTRTSKLVPDSTEAKKITPSPQRSRKSATAPTEKSPAGRTPNHRSTRSTTPTTTKTQSSTKQTGIKGKKTQKSGLSEKSSVLEDGNKPRRGRKPADQPAEKNE